MSHTATADAPAPPAVPRMGTQEWLLLLVLSLLWGGSFLFVKVAVAEVPPLTLVWLRVVIAAPILWLAVRLTGGSMRVGLATWGALAVMGLLNNLIPFSLIFWGQARIPSGVASILNATTPLFGVIVMHLFSTSEKATGLKVAGVLAGLAGVAVLMGEDALRGLGGDLLPQLACLGGALSYAFSGLWSRRLTHLPPLVTAAGQITATTVMMLPLALVIDRPWLLPPPSPEAVLSVLALAVLSTALAYAIFFRIMKAAGASNVLLVTFLIPISAILLGTLVLGEALLPRHFLGMACIFLGLALIDGRALRWMRRR